MSKSSTTVMKQRKKARAIRKGFDDKNTEDGKSYVRGGF